MNKIFGKNLGSPKKLFSKEKVFSASNLQNSHGFSLVEVLIALTIFITLITGVSTAIYKSGVSANTAKNRLIANYLAQEGIEIVRAKRDSYVLSNQTSYVTGWQNFVSNVNEGCPLGSACDIDASSLTNLGPTSGNQFIACGINLTMTSPCVFWYSNDGFYLHNLTVSTGTKTPFVRTLVFVPHYTSGGGPVVEFEINSTVYWKDGMTTQSVSMNESLFNWYASQ